jgi:RNase adapter protein RapZ
MAKPKSKEQSVPETPIEPALTSDLVIITGLSGSGKLTALKSFEDLGFYAVDNLPIALVPKFADLIRDSKSGQRAALIIDIREGGMLENFPQMYRELKKHVSATLIFLDADDEVLQRRFSETRRPHPLGAKSTVLNSIQEERTQLKPIQDLADLCIDTSKLNVHELRRIINGKFQDAKEENKILVYVNSFGFRNGVPPDSDLVFDVRFLPNPNYIPEFKRLSGRQPAVARYIRSFPQTVEFINRISELLIYLLPHYIREGKSYLTISFGCTGGQHRSVMIAHEIQKRLAKAGFTVKESHRDMNKH